MPGPRDEVERVLDLQRHDVELGLFLQRAGLGDEEIEFPAAQALQQFVPVAGVQQHVDARVLLGEPGHGRSEERFRRERATADGHAAGPQVALRDRFTVEVVGHSQQVAGALDVQAPEVRRHDAAARTGEQLAAEVLLEALDAARKCRLADVQRGGCAHETAVLGQRQHLAQLLEFERHALIVYRQYAICIGHMARRLAP